MVEVSYTEFREKCTEEVNMCRFDVEQGFVEVRSKKSFLFKAFETLLRNITLLGRRLSLHQCMASFVQELNF